jgi:dTDP-4-amino-4,6-dideoxygalactose transaminase
MPAGFVARLSEAQARLGSRRLRALPAEIARRRAIAHRYSDWLLAAARTPAAEPPGIEHVFLRYPLLVDDRPRFVIAARQAGIDLGDWFVSPVHPVVNGLERWGYTSGRAPVAERVCAQIVNLPVDPGLDEADITRVLRFLERHAGQIL